MKSSIDENCSPASLLDWDRLLDPDRLFDRDDFDLEDLLESPK